MRSLIDPALGARYHVGHVPEEFLREAADEGVISCDIETTPIGDLPFFVKCVTLGVPGQAVALDPRRGEEKALLTRVLRDARQVVFWNSPFDVPHLYLEGIVDLDFCSKIIDGVIWSRMAAPSSTGGHRLADASAKYLRLPHGKLPVQLYGFRSDAEWYRHGDLHMYEYVVGACQDAVTTARLRPIVYGAVGRALVTENPYLRMRLFRDKCVSGDGARALAEREQILNRALVRRQCIGYRVDFNFLEEYADRTEERYSRLRDELRAAGIDSVSKGAQLIAAIGEENLPPDYPRTLKTGRPSCTKDDLELLDHPLAAKYREARHIDKILNDYLQKCRDLADKNGRIHPQVNVLAAVSGRSSVNNPPIQQFPGSARGILLAEEGRTMSSVDWAQIEPTVMSMAAGQDDIIDQYLGGSKVYEVISNVADVPYKKCKTILLGLMYGQGIPSMCRKHHFDVREAEDIRNAMFDAMPKVERFLRDTKDLAKQYAKVMTVSGRVVPIEMGTYTNKATGETRRGLRAHTASNYFCQGSAYDVLSAAYVRCVEAGLGDQIYFLVHDEIVCDSSVADEVERIMKEPQPQLTKWAGREVPLMTDRAELGERWAAA